MTLVRLALAAAVAAVGLPGVAAACSCVEPNLARSWHEVSDTLKVEILRETTIGQYNYYEAEVQRTFSGCTEPGDRIVVESYRSSAACGIPLEVGATYLLTATRYDSRDAPHAFQVNLCGFNKPWSQVTSTEKSYLNSRPVYCPRTDEVTCADGEAPVACIVNPCAVDHCPTADRCEPNYCGGCTAEFYDETWEPECRPW